MTSTMSAPTISRRGPSAPTESLTPEGAGSTGHEPAACWQAQPAKRRDESLLAEQDDPERTYLQRVGERLRTVRRRQRLSLRDVERASKREFRVSALAAYERGQRAISVVRLQRLARLYNVPVDGLLPRSLPDGAGQRRRRCPTALPAGGKLALDLVRLAHADLPGKPLLVAYVHAVQVRRKDLHSRVITLRDADAPIIAGMLSLTVEELRQRLREHGVYPGREPREAP